METQHSKGKACNIRYQSFSSYSPCLSTSQRRDHECSVERVSKPVLMNSRSQKQYFHCAQLGNKTRRSFQIYRRPWIFQSVCYRLNTITVCWILLWCDEILGGIKTKTPFLELLIKKTLTSLKSKRYVFLTISVVNAATPFFLSAKASLVKLK